MSRVDAPKHIGCSTRTLRSDFDRRPSTHAARTNRVDGAAVVMTEFKRNDFTTPDYD
jgi:hypothetical protein